MRGRYGVLPIILVISAFGVLAGCEEETKTVPQTVQSHQQPFTEADAIERVHVWLWAVCSDFPQDEYLHSWQATDLGERRWSVTSIWSPIGAEHYHLEWRVYFDKGEGWRAKPADQDTAIFEDSVVRNRCRSGWP